MCWSPALVKSGGRVPKTKAIVSWRHRLESDSLEFANLGGGGEAERPGWLSVRGTPENLVSIECSQARV